MSRAPLPPELLDSTGFWALQTRLKPCLTQSTQHKCFYHLSPFHTLIHILFPLFFSVLVSVLLHFSGRKRRLPASFIASRCLSFCPMSCRSVFRPHSQTRYTTRLHTSFRNPDPAYRPTTRTSRGCMTIFLCLASADPRLSSIRSFLFLTRCSISRSCCQSHKIECSLGR